MKNILDTLEENYNEIDNKDEPQVYSREFPKIIISKNKYYADTIIEDEDSTTIQRQFEELACAFPKDPKIFSSYYVVRLSSGLVQIPVSLKYIVNFISCECFPFQYIDFDEYCGLKRNKTGLKTERLRKIAFINNQIEYYFSIINLTWDENFRKRMDPYGYVSCLFVFALPEIKNLNINYDFFIKALEHSPHLKLSLDNKFVRTKYSPEFWAENIDPSNPVYNVLTDVFSPEDIMEFQPFRNILKTGPCCQMMLKFQGRLLESVRDKIPFLGQIHNKSKLEMNPFDFFFQTIRNFKPIFDGMNFVI